MTEKTKAEKTEIHKGGYFRLARQLERRQRPFDNVELVIPPADIDLDGLYTDRVPPPLKTVADCPKNSAEAKWVQLQEEFQDQSALLLVHAMMIAITRRQNPPREAVDLFHRMWAEKGAEMSLELPTRWLISAATTFADHGKTGDQRALGMGLSTLFDLIKLHDSERRVTGQLGHRPFEQNEDVKPAPMPLGMRPYSLRNGDLDRIMLARFWKLCERDATIRPLGMRMLWKVMTDRRTIFGRVQNYKRKGAK